MYLDIDSNDEKARRAWELKYKLYFWAEPELSVILLEQ